MMWNSKYACHHFYRVVSSSESRISQRAPNYSKFILHENEENAFLFNWVFRIFGKIGVLGIGAPLMGNSGLNYSCHVTLCELVTIFSFRSTFLPTTRWSDTQGLFQRASGQVPRAPGSAGQPAEDNDKDRLWRRRSHLSVSTVRLRIYD